MTTTAALGAGVASRFVLVVVNMRFLLLENITDLEVHRMLEWDSQLHDQVEVVGTLVDVFQRHDVLMFDPAKARKSM